MASGLVGLALAWTIIGIGIGYGLYEAAFATATGLLGRNARSAITGITFFAGFASTIGWPTTSLFIREFGWRGACRGWAVLHMVLGLPLNRFLVPRQKPVKVEEALSPTPMPANVPTTMIILAGVFAACWFVSVAMTTSLPRLLEVLGAPPATAIGAAALVGLAQVGARLIEFALLRRASPLLSARLAAALPPLAAACLLVLDAPAAILFSLLHGGGNGLLTIARGTLPLALFGAQGYGLRVGILAAPGRMLQSAAPLMFSLVLDHRGSYDALLLSCGLSSLALFTLIFVQRPTPRRAEANI